MRARADGAARHDLGKNRQGIFGVGPESGRAARSYPRAIGLVPTQPERRPSTSPRKMISLSLWLAYEVAEQHCIGGGHPDAQFCVTQLSASARRRPYVGLHVWACGVRARRYGSRRHWQVQLCLQPETWLCCAHDSRLPPITRRHGAARVRGCRGMLFCSFFRAGACRFKCRS